MESDDRADLVMSAAADTIEVWQGDDDDQWYVSRGIIVIDGPYSDRDGAERALTRVEA